MKKTLKYYIRLHESKTMFDDPRVKARSFLESSSIISELEDVLNRLVYEKPDDLHGFLVSQAVRYHPYIRLITFILKYE